MDLDFLDERFDESLAPVVGAGPADQRDLVGDGGETGPGRHRRWYVDLVGEFGAAMAELGALGQQVREAAGEDLLVEGAALERGEIPVDGLAGPGEFRVDGGEFRGAVVVSLVVVEAGGGDGVRESEQLPDDLTDDGGLLPGQLAGEQDRLVERGDGRRPFA